MTVKRNFAEFIFGLVAGMARASADGGKPLALVVRCEVAGGLITVIVSEGHADPSPVVLECQQDQFQLATASFAAGDEGPYRALGFLS